MGEVMRKRMLLDRVATDAPGLAEATARVRASPDIALLRENSPNSLLVEGASETIQGLVGGLRGWRALPAVAYARPVLRPRTPKRPPGG